MLKNCAKVAHVRNFRYCGFTSAAADRSGGGSKCLNHGFAGLLDFTDYRHRIFKGSECGRIAQKIYQMWRGYPQFSGITKQSQRLKIGNYYTGEK